jgi:GNAT superfamily N-acetyltransferase
MSGLWNSNHPRDFWLCQPEFPDEIWDEAVVRALPLLGFKDVEVDSNSFQELTLGEGQFGPKRYHFGFTRNLYYMVKPMLPRAITYFIRRAYNSLETKSFTLDWPIEPRYAWFQWELLRQALLLSGKNEIDFMPFWPLGKQFAFVLTHDVETAAGQRAIPILADIEESLGFRSLFNIVPERYKLDLGLLRDLRRRGFEIGLHGLKHDGKLFSSYSTFTKRAAKINHYLREFQAVGFRAPLTHRNPEWMQLLEIEYDLSFFDTDPFEPMPGGVMSIWPFRIGRFIELPYTLVQDGTLFNVIGESSQEIWLRKIDFLIQYNGLALMLVHPDYSSTGIARHSYDALLREVKDRGGYWHALPREVMVWWKQRMGRDKNAADRVSQPLAQAALTKNGISIKNLTSTYLTQCNGMLCNEE